MALQEDFSDVAEFVQEDDEQNASEDEVERKIAEEHAKYKEAQAKRQEEVRASRPWSAAPVDSPRPEQQKERERERQARGSNPEAVADAPRAEYEPPMRPYLPQAQASGSNLSYLSRPQSAEARSGNRLMNGRTSRTSLSGIEEETGEGTAANSRRASELGRPGSHPNLLGEAPPRSEGSGRQPDAAPSRDQYGAIKEEGEEDEAEQDPKQDAAGGGQGSNLEWGIALARAAAVAAAAESSAAPVPDVEEQAGEEEEEEEGEAGEPRGNVLGGEEDEKEPGVRGGGMEPSAQEIGEDDGEDEDEDRRSGAADGDGEEAPGAGVAPGSFSSQQPQQHQRPSWQGSAAGSGSGAGPGAGAAAEGVVAPSGRSGPPSVAGSAAATTPRSLALRGFVEPMGVPEEKVSGSGEIGNEEEEDGDKTDEEEEDDYEDDYEDSFEAETEEDTGQASAEPSSARAPSVQQSGSIRSRAPSSIRLPPPPSKEPSRAMSPPPPASYPTTPGSDVSSPGVPPPPPAAEASVASGAAAAAADSRPPPPSSRSSMTAASQRSHSTGVGVGGGGGTATAAAAAVYTHPDSSDLLPPQQFALQLLKHDIDVLPQHHRAAAEAAVAARRKTSATSRPAGSGLAAFGYLGYHISPEDLTAPSGPAFRTASPGRTSSPGRGSGGGGSYSGAAAAAAGGAGQGLTLVTVSSMKAARLAGAEDGPGAVLGAGGAAGGRGGRHISAPHLRPVGEGGVPAVGAPAAKEAAASNFVGAAREMRAVAARLLPPVGPPVAAVRAARMSSGGSGRAGPAATDSAASAPTDPGALSVLDEQETNNVQHSRIKFDVWLDSLAGSGGNKAAADQTVAAAAAAAATPPSNGQGGGNTGGGRRPPRPMTAPASGRRRPVSARPTGGSAAGLYGIQGPAGGVPRPLARPISAQPFSYHGRPASASHTGGGGGGRGGNTLPGLDPSFGGVESIATQQSVGGFGGVGHEGLPVPLPPAPPAGVTAAVEIGGVTVSVYVADTLKRIVEANRWLQQLGVTTKRYRLKDRLSAMTVQLIEELPPLPSERETYDPYDGGAVAVVKELTLKQFLSGHAKLKQQAKKLRNTAGSPSLPPTGMGSMGGAGAGSMGGGAPYGATELSGGGGSSRAYRPFSATPGGAGIRARPASAVPHVGGIRPVVSSAGGADPALYGYGTAAAGVAAGQAAFPAGRPARPSSANPAYGRTPTFPNPSYASGGGSSPPGASAGHFAAAYGGGSRGGTGSGAAPGGGSALPHTRPAWGAFANGGPSAGGGHPQHHQNYTFTSTGGGAAIVASGLPYMYRSVSARAAGGAVLLDEQDMDDSGELAMMVEPDENGDVTRAVRHQLGGAADYCQAKRHEIARLRTMPYA